MSHESFIQHSSDRFQQRSGKFIASEIWRLFDIPEVSKAYIESVVRERVYFQAMPKKSSFPTPWEKKYRPIARKLFENTWGYKVQEAGFYEPMDPQLAGWVWASLDGIIPEIGAGIVIKCPNKNLFLQSRDYGQVIWKHRFQLTCLALVTGLTRWFYISFNPSVEGQQLYVRPFSWFDLPIKEIRDRLVQVVKRAKELEEKLRT
ncbi:MAG: YqaJ viral recombinase family protein [Spirochaetales bacterium]